MGLLRRIEQGPEARHLPSNVIAVDKPRERRAPRRWYEKAEDGVLQIKEYTGQIGPDAA